MRKIFILLILSLLLISSWASAQETYFGKNKVQYRRFSWEYIQTDHFDIYYYDSRIHLAEFAADELEKAYDIISRQLKYFVKKRIPIFIYNSHNDFQQTNIINEEPSEGTQGFTEVFKKRIVVHFMGSYEEFRHLLHHELTHAVVYDLVYGEFFKAVLSPNRLFAVPLWLAEGYAEYSSNGGWTNRADMMVRDASIHGYMRPPGYMGMLAYTEGFALVKYIADTYGEDKIGELFKKGKSLLTIDKAMNSSIGIKSEKIFEKFNKEMKKRYWPDISLRQEPAEFAERLTNHEKDASHYNEKPVFHPKGQILAMFTDRGGYSEIYLISAIDGKKIKRLVKGQRSADLESLRWYTSGMSFSPDGENMVFVSKSKGEDAINFVRLDNTKIYLRKKFGLNSIISPAWSPDGEKVAFSALLNGARDLFMYNLTADSLIRLTDDRYDDIDVAWHRDSQRLVFSSDRPHPGNPETSDTSVFIYGLYSIHQLDIESGELSPLMVGEGQNKEPTVSPDGNRIAFVSSRSGIDNIYIYNVNNQQVEAVSNVLTNAKSPTWSPDGDMIAFSTFFKAGYDIYLIKNIEAKGDNGSLLPTDFVLGKYDHEQEWARPLYQDPKTVALAGTAYRHKAPHDRVSEDPPSPDDPDFPNRVRAVGSLPLTLPDQNDNDSLAVAVTDENEDEEIEEPAPTTDSLDTVADSPEVVETPDDDDEEEYVYRSQEDESVFILEGDLDESSDGDKFAEAILVDGVNADSLDNILPNGEYRVRKYKTKFTPDFISGGLQYDSFFGFRGQTVFAFSDYLGDHRIYIATDLVNTIDQSNIQIYYIYSKLKLDFAFGLFHTKNFYIDSDNNLFSDRFYGISGNISWPQSKFTRFDFSTASVFIDRKYYDESELSGRNVQIITGNLSWIHDTVLWGITGPVNGHRYKVTLDGAIPMSSSDSINYYGGQFDYRHYLPLGRPFSFAFRLSGGFSNGPHRKNFYLGGNTNRIGSISVDSDVYKVENLYFSGIITPLRGYDYYELSGTRYVVSNFELHFPFIEYFLMRYPLTIGLSQVTGALFVDMGAVWDEGDETFKGGTSKGGSHLVGIKSGFGFGARANLGFLLLRYDMAWRTDYHSVEPHTKHYFSLGADF